MDQTSIRATFIKDLREALNHLQDPAFLRRSPLAATFGIGNQFDSFSVLQQNLTDAVRSLEPADDEPERSRAWRTYDCLFYRYVQQFTQLEVADQIGISTRQLQREQQVALERLADLLWERIEQDTIRGNLTPPTEDVSSDASATALSDELGWLRDVSTKESTELNQLLLSVLELAKPLADTHGVQFELEIESGLPPLAANSVALNQTLLNLLTVAIHRAGSSETCDHGIRVSAHATRWGSQVKIDCDETDGALQPTGDDESSLAMAFQLAELGGVRLSMDEFKDGFHARLRLQAVEQMPVLLIDDNEDALRLMQRYASGTPYRLIVSSSPNQIATLVQEHDPQIIVLDVMMPDVSGWSVLTELRTHPPTKNIPIIICTILPQEDLANSLGASGYIRKPVMREAFLDALNRAVARMALESH